MAEAAIAKLFMNGRSQAVRLPKELRFKGDRVRVRRVGTGVLLEPMETAFDVKAWFAELDRLQEKYGPFLPDWPEARDQPDMPPDPDFSDVFP